MKLIVTVGYYQTLIAVRLKQTIFAEEECSLIITDASRDGKILFNNIIKENLFSKVYYFEEYVHFRPEVKRSAIRRFKGLSDCVFGKSNILRKLIADADIDEMIFYDVSLTSIALFAYLYEINKNIKVSMMEEGLLSYDTINKILEGSTGKKRKMLYALRIFFNKGNLTDNIYSIYVQMPNQISDSLRKKVVRIPPIWETDYKFRELASRIWQVNPSDLQYNEKYIYFSTTDEDFDVVAVNKISENVGKDQILIKLHPRNFSDTFINMGYRVDRSSGCPWEIIGMNYDFSGKIFISGLSSATLFQFLLGQDIQSIYLADTRLFKKTMKKNYTSLVESAKEILSVRNIDSSKWIFLREFEELTHYLGKAKTNE